MHAENHILREGKWSRRWAIVVLFLAAAGVRLITLAHLQKAPTFQTLVLDARDYHQRALQWGSGQPDPVLFWQSPLYPMFLALIYRVLGPSHLTARAAQALLGAASVVLTWRLGLRWFGRAVAWWAAAAVMFWMPLIVYEIDLVADGLAALMGLMLLDQISAMRSKSPPTWRPVVLGAIAAASVLWRPNFGLFVVGLPFLLIAIAPRGQRLRALTYSAIGACVVLCPIAQLSFRLTGRWNPLPFSGGLNLYLGNSPDLCATLRIRPGYAWDEMETLPERYGAVLPPAREAFFRQQVWAFLRKHPAQFLRNLGAKTVRFVNSRELPRNEDIYRYRAHSPLVRALLWKWRGWGFPFGILIAGLALCAVTARRSVPIELVTFLVLYAVAVILVFVSARYRAAWIPPAVILAARGFHGWFQLWSQRRWIRAVLATTLAAAASVASAWPARFCEEEVHYEAEECRLVGYYLAKEGRIAEAESWLRRSLELEPSADAFDYLAAVLLRQGRTGEALAALQSAVQSAPASARFWNNLGLLLVQLNRKEEAELAFQRAHFLAPHDRRISENLARLQALRPREGTPAGTPTVPVN